MPRKAQSKNAVYNAIVSEVTEKPKRKRRTKAEMQALRAAAAQAVVYQAVAVKPKRKRRTKAEMQAFREAQKQEQSKTKLKKNDAVVDTRTSFVEKAKTACGANNSDKNKIVFKFGCFVVKALDKNNLSLELQDSGSSVFLGYYQPTAASLIKMLENIGARLLIFPRSAAKALMTQKQQAQALSEVNTILDALHKFKTFLRAEFISENKDNGLL